jgi:hypothetical protein
MTITITDPRERLLVLEALVLAIETMSRLPEIYRPESDIDDLKEFLNDLSERELVMHQASARRRLNVLLGLPPEPPAETAD